MTASDYNLCISADHKDVVIARNHGMGFHDNNVVTGQFEWVCEQLGYIKKRKCDTCDGLGWCEYCMWNHPDCYAPRED